MNALRLVARLLLLPVLPVSAADETPVNRAATSSLDVERIASRADPGFWLENMLVHHRYRWEEAAGVMGWSVEETKAKASSLKVIPGQPAPVGPGGKVRILPYPGGRHPRIGFLDGAIDPQRGTKLSLFPPWRDGGYVVLDLPEAIFSNLGLTFLAHTHIPTIWSQQNIVITNADWSRGPGLDGGLRSEWALPNGIRFGAVAVPRVDGADCELWLTNGTQATLKELRTQICLMLKGAPGFDHQTQDGKEYAKPLAVARAVGADRYILLAFERCGRAWGNPPCPCIHSDPVLPEAAPGQRVSVRGSLRFYEGADVAAAKKRLVEELTSAPSAARAATNAAPAALKSTNTYSEAYGKTKNAVTLDPAKDLPHYPAVEPGAAAATWKVKAGFRLELAAHEPQVRDPIAICFDERGRMFVCEMIDYSERREVSPHLGRISMLEDRDGDGHFESSTVFADDLPWPTGLIWVRGGLYVAATPDVWRFEDRDGDGRAEVRAKAFTGFGTGLTRLNVQGMLNSLQWGQDNRVHVLAGGGNRGIISSPKRPDRPGQELGGRDFWFDPATHEFGFEMGGAQFGLSFDDFGRKFGCSNSDHLQYWVYEGDPGQSDLPPARQSIAVDGGAAEVYRISPDEPWRIVRTRWRISGTVPGMVEGGGRVSGYFTGATGTTIYRGDAYGPEFVNNSFTGDAGGQLVHRKVIRQARDGVNLEGERPADERRVEFAASADTWVRVVNFANAPDGCLYVCDMYREIIEHPWSIPEEIKQHLDLNNGHDRGRVWRILPERGAPRKGERVTLDRADTAELVRLLSHPNGWHRDTAQRLLHERQDPAAVPRLESVVQVPHQTLAKLHALGLLASARKMRVETLISALADRDAFVRERALTAMASWPDPVAAGSSLAVAVGRVVDDPEPRVRFQLAFTLAALLHRHDSAPFTDALVRLARRDYAHPWIGPALLRAPARVIGGPLFAAFTSDPSLTPLAGSFVRRLIEIRASSASSAEDRAALMEWVARGEPRPDWLRALGEGLRRAGVSIAEADLGRKMEAVFALAASRAADPRTRPELRLSALEILSFASLDPARAALERCLRRGESAGVQAAAMKALLQHASTEATQLALARWADLGLPAREILLEAFLQRQDRTRALLGAIERNEIPAGALSAARVQMLTQHKEAAIAAQARKSLAALIPPSRAEALAKYRDAITTRGSAARGRTHFTARCAPCHRADGEGVLVAPDLVTVKNRGREALLASILEPSKEVAAQYIVYEVTTKDGDTYSGFIAEDNATSVTLKMAGGLTQTVQRSQIQGTTSAGQSLMPEGLETGMTIEDLADLLTFIEELR